MEILPTDMLEVLKLNFESEIAAIINQIGTKFANIASHTVRFEEIQADSLERLCNEVDKGVSASEEFILHCEVLSNELNGIEELARQVHLMRKGCEELEKKLAKLKY